MPLLLSIDRTRCWGIRCELAVNGNGRCEFNCGETPPGAIPAGDTVTAGEFGAEGIPVAGTVDETSPPCTGPPEDRGWWRSPTASIGTGVTTGDEDEVRFELFCCSS